MTFHIKPHELYHKSHEIYFHKFLKPFLDYFHSSKIERDYFFFILEKTLTMAKKGGMPVYKTVEDYINNQSEKAQVILNELRHIITETIPEVIEIENSKAPTFKIVSPSENKLQLMMGAYAKYVSFYPFPSTMEAFSEELKDFKQGKGSVQFPFNKPLPKDCIVRMILHRKNEIENE